MKRKRTKILAMGFLILAGILGMLYPLASNFLYESRQDTILTEYEVAVEQTDSQALATALEDARSYNERLRTSTAILTDPFDSAQYQVNDTEYTALLNWNGDGIMGYLEIPSIEVKLPIYHGTSEAVLSQGVGHLEQSSLPVGGTGTHAVLSGHTGLASKRLFTDLSQLQVGDSFSITVLDQRLTYQVDEINVVEPHETELLRITDGQDYVTLLTCTPYGINSHRLLVRGVRISDTEDNTATPEPLEETIHRSQWVAEYLKSLLMGGGCVVVMLSAWIGGSKWIAKKRGGGA
jgi:sortase A